MDIVRFASAEETGYRRVLGEVRRWLRQETDGKRHAGISHICASDIQALEIPGGITSTENLFFKSI